MVEHSTVRIIIQFCISVHFSFAGIHFRETGSFGQGNAWNCCLTGRILFCFCMLFDDIQECVPLGFRRPVRSHRFTGIRINMNAENTAHLVSWVVRRLRYMHGNFPQPEVLTEDVQKQAFIGQRVRISHSPAGISDMILKRPLCDLQCLVIGFNPSDYDRQYPKVPDRSG